MSRVRYTPEQKEEMRMKDHRFKAEGKTDKYVASTLGIAIATLYKLRKSDGKAPVKRGRPGRKPGWKAAGVQPTVQLSSNNPMYQLAIAHERMMQIAAELAKLNKEREELEKQMKGLMVKAAEVCPGLKAAKK